VRDRSRDTDRERQGVIRALRPSNAKRLYTDEESGRERKNKKETTHGY